MIFSGVSAATALQKIPGFEASAYAYARGRVVWAGGTAVTRHPRDHHAPWQPVARHFDVAKLRRGAGVLRRRLDASSAPDGHPLQAKGLLLWLTGQPMAFPLNHAVARFDAIQSALQHRDARRFEAAAVRVLGLGHGLTPSGDDFVGGIFFALRHLPKDALGEAWQRELPAVALRIRNAAASATNVISAALLGDLMAGKSYSALHEMLAALESEIAIKIEAAYVHIARLGATSGADMLAGVLLALTFAHTAIKTENKPETETETETTAFQEQP